jgi:dihydrolipoamide dehydrogenase
MATGSVPVLPPIQGASGNERVVDSTGLLSIPAVPARLTVIGGGVIGVEFASLFSMLGSDVTVVEMLDEIIPFADEEMAGALRSSLSGVTFHLGSEVKSIEDGFVHYASKEGIGSVESDVILVAVGRRPLIDGWGAADSGLEVSPRGVRVDDRLRTNLPNVWAVGDVTGRSLLAHAAYRMAEVAAANILDPRGAALRGEVMRWDTIPWAVYSVPEAAGVGLTEREATRRGHVVIAATVPHVLSGRFVAENGTTAPGSTKIVADAETRRVLGIHLVGPSSAEMIWGAVAALEAEFTVRDLRQIVFPHPTISEVVREAVWALPD